jgi:hypothetical protein
MGNEQSKRGKEEDRRVYDPALILKMMQSRRNAESASGACCPGGEGRGSGEGTAGDSIAGITDESAHMSMEIKS